VVGVTVVTVTTNDRKPAFDVGVDGVWWSFKPVTVSVSFPSWLTGTALSATVAGFVGELLRPLRNVVPVDTVLGILQDVLTLWPVLAAFLIFSWIWRHMPTIGGFGTGDG
jgi:hypothetical protein